MKLFFSPAGERLSTDLPQRRELSGKRILITGAAKGIGAGIAEVFAENGADLLLHYRSSPEEAEALKTRLSAFGGAIHLCRADLGTKEGIETLFAEADRVFGGLDAAVNNAGWDPGYMALEDITFESYEKLTSMNIRGTLFCCLNEIRRMRRNTPPGGSIVNIGSVQMETSVRGRTLYAASKGAIHSMTGQLSLECGKDHIRINAIAPRRTARHRGNGPVPGLRTIHLPLRAEHHCGRRSLPQTRTRSESLTFRASVRQWSFRTLSRMWKRYGMRTLPTVSPRIFCSRRSNAAEAIALKSCSSAVGAGVR